MIVIEKNAGKKIPYEVVGNKITFNDEIMLNLEKYEKEYPVHIDVCRNNFEMLVVGVERNSSYVAQIDIPAAAVAAAGEGEDAQVVQVPFDMSKIELTLWSTEKEEKEAV